MIVVEIWQKSVTSVRSAADNAQYLSSEGCTWTTLEQGVSKKTNNVRVVRCMAGLEPDWNSWHGDKGRDFDTTPEKA